MNPPLHNLFTLPHEVLYLLYSFLDLPSLLSLSIRCSKATFQLLEPSIHRIASYRYIGYPLQLNRFPRVSNLVFPLGIQHLDRLQIGKELLELEIGQHPKIDLLHLSSTCPSLTRLHLGQSAYAQVSSWAFLPRSLTYLACRSVAVERPRNSSVSPTFPSPTPAPLRTLISPFDLMPPLLKTLIFSQYHHPSRAEIPTQELNTIVAGDFSLHASLGQLQRLTHLELPDYLVLEISKQGMRHFPTAVVAQGDTAPTASQQHQFASSPPSSSYSSSMPSCSSFAHLSPSSPLVLPALSFLSCRSIRLLVKDVDELQDRFPGESTARSIVTLNGQRKASEQQHSDVEQQQEDRSSSSTGGHGPTTSATSTSSTPTASLFMGLCLPNLVHLSTTRFEVKLQDDDNTSSTSSSPPSCSSSLLPSLPHRHDSYILLFDAHVVLPCSSLTSLHIEKRSKSASFQPLSTQLTAPTLFPPLPSSPSSIGALPRFWALLDPKQDPQAGNYIGASPSPLQALQYLSCPASPCLVQALAPPPSPVGGTGDVNPPRDQPHDVTQFHPQCASIWSLFPNLKALRMTDCLIRPNYPLPATSASICLLIDPLDELRFDHQDAELNDDYHGANSVLEDLRPLKSAFALIGRSTESSWKEELLQFAESLSLPPSLLLFTAPLAAHIRPDLVKLPIIVSLLPASPKQFYLTRSTFAAQTLKVPPNSLSSSIDLPIQYIPWALSQDVFVRRWSSMMVTAPANPFGHSPSSSFPTSSRPFASSVISAFPIPSPCASCDDEVQRSDGNDAEDEDLGDAKLEISLLSSFLSLHFPRGIYSYTMRLMRLWETQQVKHAAAVHQSQAAGNFPSAQDFLRMNPPSFRSLLHPVFFLCSDIISVSSFSRAKQLLDCGLACHDAGIAAVISSTERLLDIVRTGGLISTSSSHSPTSSPRPHHLLRGLQLLLSRHFLGSFSTSFSSFSSSSSPCTLATGPEQRHQLEHYRLRLFDLVFDILLGLSTNTGSFSPAPSSSSSSSSASSTATTDLVRAVVQLLVDYGVEMNQKNALGRTWLHLAIEKRLPLLVSALLFCTSVGVGRQESPLPLLPMSPSYTLPPSSSQPRTHSSTEMPRLFFAVDIRSIDLFGMSAQQEALSCGFSEIKALMLQRMAASAANEKFYGATSTAPSSSSFGSTTSSSPSPVTHPSLSSMPTTLQPFLAHQGSDAQNAQLPFATPQTPTPAPGGIGARRKMKDLAKWEAAQK